MVILLELFTVFTMIWVIVLGDYLNLLLCLATLGLILVPAIVEKLFSCRIQTVLYVVGVFYAIGPLIGDCYKLYYLTSWWDKLLHTLGGVVFAMFGAYLFERISGKKTKVLASAVFALCFSIAVSACWEFVEFGCDVFFDMDMQNDTLLNSISSYQLGEELGKIGHIENVSGVVINGSTEIAGGYLDIGLYDSMTDMLLESLGAVTFFVVYLLDKGKHPLFVTQKNKRSNFESV